MTALILATKSHLSFWGSRIAFVRQEIFGAGRRFDDTARERFSLVLFGAVLLLLCFYVVSVNVILGEGGTIGFLERAIRTEEISLLDTETVFAVQSSAEQLKKYEVVRRMEEIGKVEYVRLGSPSLVDVSHILP
ncbi:MAG: hypothetical protein Q7R73_00035 [bacterium]|nr:hypothetical protein [bacterium]